MSHVHSSGGYNELKILHSLSRKLSQNIRRRTAFDEAGERFKKGLARHPVAVIILVRLAVASSMQGQGLGAGLLKDAALRTFQAADIAGIRALVVHTKNDDLRAFNERYDFTPSPTDTPSVAFVEGYRRCNSILITD